MKSQGDFENLEPRSKTGSYSESKTGSYSESKTGLYSESKTGSYSESKTGAQAGSSGGRSERTGGQSRYAGKADRDEETSSYAGERAKRSVHQDAGRSAAAKEGTTSHRIQRVEREIREVVGSYLISGFRGSLPGIVSITRVICSKDLRTSKIFVTVMGLSDEIEGSEVLKEAAVDELQKHAFEVQREINVRLRLRHCPRVSFLYDDGFENVMKVERILMEIERTRIASETKARLEAERVLATEAGVAVSDSGPDTNSINESAAEAGSESSPVAAPEGN